MEQIQDNSLTIHKCIWDITTYILTKPNISINIYYNSADIFGVQVIDNQFKDTSIINAFEYTKCKDRHSYIETIIDIINKIGEYIQLQVSIDNTPFDIQSILTAWNNTRRLKINIINKTLLPYYENYSSVMLFYNFMFDMETMNQALNNHHWLKALEETKDSDGIYDWPKDIDDIKDCLEPLNPRGITLEMDLTEIKNIYPHANTEDEISANIGNQKHITLELFVNIHTGVITLTVGKYTPTIWDIPTMDITDKHEEILTLTGHYTSISQALENDLNKSKANSKYTTVIYTLKDLLDIISDIAYRNEN